MAHIGPKKHQSVKMFRNLLYYTPHHTKTWFLNTKKNTVILNQSNEDFIHILSVNIQIYVVYVVFSVFIRQQIQFCTKFMM